MTRETTSDLIAVIGVSLSVKQRAGLLIHLNTLGSRLVTLDELTEMTGITKARLAPMLVDFLMQGILIREPLRQNPDNGATTDVSVARWGTSVASRDFLDGVREFAEKHNVTALGKILQKRVCQLVLSYLDAADSTERTASAAATRLGIPTEEIGRVMVLLIRAGILQGGDERQPGRINTERTYALTTEGRAVWRAVAVLALYETNSMMRAQKGEFPTG
jgi:hypothetical protein